MTRLEFIEQCKRFDPRQRNAAIQTHIAKLEAMSDADWPAHQRHLAELRERARLSVKAVCAQALGEKP